MDADYIISMRRYFHKNPELSFHEYKTADRIEEELKGMGLKRIDDNFSQFTGEQFEYLMRELIMDGILGKSFNSVSR